MHRIQIEDCRNIGKLECIEWDTFKGKNVLITGATGLIGSNLVNALAYNSNEKGLGIQLVLPVRNEAAANAQFSWTGAEIVPYNLGDELKVTGQVDYIIHLASPTSSRFFSEKPVDTLLANIEGTRALLDFAKTRNISKFISVSSMEVYGFPNKGRRVKENEIGAFETMKARNSYPIAKIASEALCYGYYSQYGLPTVILRATQTFGPGIKYEDGRVFAQFMRCAVEGKDIVLKSFGETERSYLYTADAVSAILVAMGRAEPGQAYTIANPQTYCSIKDMAELVAIQFGGGNIKIVFDVAEDITKLGYAETLYMDLDTSKMEQLGWKAKTGLGEMFERMIESAVR